MYVRITRFEGGTVEGGLEQAEQIRSSIEGYRRGESSGQMPLELADAVSKVEVLVDRQRGRVATAVYCETEQQMNEADRILDAMQPPRGDWGQRVSVDIYELLAEESTSSRKAA
jgi:hypothetical protein